MTSCVLKKSGQCSIVTPWGDMSIEKEIPEENPDVMIVSAQIYVAVPGVADGVVIPFSVVLWKNDVLIDSYLTSCMNRGGFGNGIYCASSDVFKAGITCLYDGEVSEGYPPVSHSLFVLSSTDLFDIRFTVGNHCFPKLVDGGV